MWSVVDHVYLKGGVSIQSDWSRLNALAVSAAASLGLITTESSEGFGRVWRVTFKGIVYLETGAL